MERSEVARYPCVGGSDKQPHLSRADLPTKLPLFIPPALVHLRLLPTAERSPVASSTPASFKTQRDGKRSPASRSNYDTPPGNLASRGQPTSENNFDVAFDPLLSLFELLDVAIQK